MTVAKKPFRFLRKWEAEERNPDGSVIMRTHCEYEADFWEGPIYPGQVGRYVTHRCTDTIYSGRFANTAPSVSYYSDLARACGL